MPQETLRLTVGELDVPVEFLTQLFTAHLRASFTSNGHVPQNGHVPASEEKEAAAPAPPSAGAP